MSRTIRRITREVRRTVRRVAREVERAGRDVWDVAADVTGAIPVLGDVMSATGLVETPAQKAAKKQEAEAQRLADENRQAIKDAQAQQQRVEDAAREDAQLANQMNNTQNAKSSGGVTSGAYTTALNGDSDNEVAASEDKLKKLLKRNV